MYQTDSLELASFNRDLERLDHLRSVIEQHRLVAITTEGYVAEARVERAKAGRILIGAIVASIVLSVSLLIWAGRLTSEGRDLVAARATLVQEKMSLQNRVRYFDKHHKGVRLEGKFGDTFFAFPGALRFWEIICPSGSRCITPVYH